MTRLLFLAVVGILAFVSVAYGQTETDLALRAGDVIAISLPGEATLTGNFQVDQEGNLNLPEIGAVHVLGLRVAEAQNAVRDRLRAAFRDVDRLRFRLLERRLPIKVLGNVRQPGQVDVPERSSMQVAIQAAGGLAEGADLTRVQLRRDKKVTVFDYQRYLDTGDLALLPALEPLDTVFVPTASRLVRVIGAVRAPGTFPWSEQLSLLDLLARAGGASAEADLTRVQILQAGRGTATPTTFDLAAFLQHGGDLGSVPRPGPGSTVVVPELAPDTGHLRPSPDGSVFVMGAVGKPSRYAFGPALSLLDLLAVAGGPTPDADLENVAVIHHAGARPDVTTLNLRQFLATGDTTLMPKLQAGDIVYVPGRNRSWLEESKESTVRVLGAVAHPARYRFDDDMTILDLLAEAGGPTADAYQQKIVVVNLSCCRDQARVFNLVEFAQTGDFTQLPVVRPGDTVYVPFIGQSNYAVFMGGVRDIFQILSTVLIATTLGAGL